MPELAEVLFATKAWAKGKGRKINKVETKNASRVFRELDPAVLKRTLKGSVLLGSETHGKKMLFRFSGERWLGLHLGMTGWLFEEDPAYPSAKHDALVLRQTERSLVFRDPRQFGRILCHKRQRRPRVVEQFANGGSFRCLHLRTGQRYFAAEKAGPRQGSPAHAGILSRNWQLDGG